MAVTKGHGNPKWTFDETILALDLYFDLDGNIPYSTDKRIQRLSKTLRAVPYHADAAKNESFRNPDGVAFKLLNLDSFSSGKGLTNVSKMDKFVWENYNDKKDEVKNLSHKILTGIQILEIADVLEDEEFVEGKVLTRVHRQKERSKSLRKKLIENRLSEGALKCEMCSCKAKHDDIDISSAMFEAHHIKPLAEMVGETKTKLKDMALLCANCHRLIHKISASNKKWYSIKAAREYFNFI